MGLWSFMQLVVIMLCLFVTEIMRAVVLNDCHQLEGGR